MRAGLRAAGRPAPAGGAIVTWARCAGCGRRGETFGMVRVVERDGGRVPLCFACYEARTGGRWHGRDEYWGGAGWLPMRAGR